MNKNITRVENGTGIILTISVEEAVDMIQKEMPENPLTEYMIKEKFNYHETIHTNQAKYYTERFSQ